MENIIDISLSSERSVIALSTICVVGWMIYVRKHIILRRNDHSSSPNDDSKPLIRTLATFGVGSLVYCMSSLVCDPNIVTLLKHCAHAIFVLCFFVFFLLFKPDHTTFKNIPKVHLCFTVLISVTTWTWLGIAITPMIFIEPYENETYVTRCNVTLIHDVSGHWNCSVSATMIEMLCDPFYIEFPTIVILFLISQWLTTISHSLHMPLRTRLPFDSAWSSPSNARFYKPLYVATILLSISFAVIYVLALRFYQQQLHEDVYTIIKLIVRIIVIVPMIAMTYQLRACRDHSNYPISASETVLIITTCSDVLWFMFRFISSAACINLDDQVTALATTVMCYAFLSVVQPVIQTKLFLDLRRKRKPLYLKNFLIFFAAFNFASWINRGLDHSISKGSPLTITPFVNALFGQYITRILLLLILPVMNLFRFHAGMVAIELIQEPKTEQSGSD